ncbi:hypothetical protein F5878DRAFT_605166 [Lentinula raphanica]|uniref:Uncharacterized protein n=1 Tax=Lentinula raphanica TaxID=153919 RepID=A0AA38PI31_9AGAR|nr:hypothetical protein F5878DRAFT_605166 [Lentinula raphanica]
MFPMRFRRVQRDVAYLWFTLFNFLRVSVGFIRALGPLIPHQPKNLAGKSSITGRTVDSRCRQGLITSYCFQHAKFHSGRTRLSTRLKALPFLKA